jgi:hypothetical protein
MAAFAYSVKSYSLLGNTFQLPSANSAALEIAKLLQTIEAPSQPHKP